MRRYVQTETLFTRLIRDSATQCAAEDSLTAALGFVYFACRLVYCY